MATSNFRIPQDRKGNLVKTPEEKEKDRVRRITEAPTQIIDRDDKPFSLGFWALVAMCGIAALAGVAYWIHSLVEASSK